MDPRSQIGRLAALRAKTDRQLLTLMLHELELAPQNPSRAEKAYTTAVLLLPTMRALQPSERRLLEQRIEDVRLGLERVSACAGMWTRRAAS